MLLSPTQERWYHSISQSSESHPIICLRQPSQATSRTYLSETGSLAEAVRRRVLPVDALLLAFLVGGLLLLLSSLDLVSPMAHALLLLRLLLRLLLQLDLTRLLLMDLLLVHLLLDLLLLDLLHLLLLRREVLAGHSPELGLHGIVDV